MVERSVTITQKGFIAALGSNIVLRALDELNRMKQAGEHDEHLEAALLGTLTDAGYVVAEIQVGSGVVVWSMYPSAERIHERLHPGGN